MRERVDVGWDELEGFKVGKSKRLEEEKFDKY